MRTSTQPLELIAPLAVSWPSSPSSTSLEREPFVSKKRRHAGIVIMGGPVSLNLSSESLYRIPETEWEYAYTFDESRPSHRVIYFSGAIVAAPTSSLSPFSGDWTVNYELSSPPLSHAVLFSDIEPLGEDAGEGLDHEFLAVLRTADEEIFEDGVESALAANIASLVQEHGQAALDSLSRVLASGAANEEALAEALKWVGRMEDKRTRRFRRKLLEKSLSSSSARIRDAAALGLASIDDANSIGPLRRAIEDEDYEELREDMMQVLRQLETTLVASHIEEDNKI